MSFNEQAEEHGNLALWAIFKWAGIVLLIVGISTTMVSNSEDVDEELAAQSNGMLVIIQQMKNYPRNQDRLNTMHEHADLYARVTADSMWTSGLSSDEERSEYLVYYFESMLKEAKKYSLNSKSQVIKELETLQKRVIWVSDAPSLRSD